MGVLGSPTFTLPKDTSPVPAPLARRDVPQCGSATGIKCGMNVCCSAASYCGTSSAHCDSCQSAFGSCAVPSPKKCGKTSGTTNSRTIGYYRGAAGTQRSCHVVKPSDIDTSKFTHLYYAFAIFDSSFNVIPQVAADTALYTQFTALKSSKLQTWIAVGGAGGSVPWRSMVSSASNRARFITSLKSFMSKYGFQGVDLDWEVPLNEADRDGYTALVKEMKTSFAGAFKISIAFPVDYGDMFYIDAKGMEPYLDWIGYMSYDLRNPDGTVAAHTDIQKIQNNALPFWFSGIPASKLNLGLASYGHGYTLANTNCQDLNCAVTGPSKPGTCIPDSTGVMALFDIQDVISSKKLTPKLNSASMFKQITFDNQWIAYDDAETVALKKGWGNDFCFGGTMQWVIDLGKF
ncbi:glycoside hydrolase superfamily [Bisporella sp. PMI_857]|nr:glycoside hydrolase superfamily [Bisporella sp. PMI_857]